MTDLDHLANEAYLADMRAMNALQIGGKLLPAFDQLDALTKKRYRAMAEALRREITPKPPTYEQSTDYFQHE